MAKERENKMNVWGREKKEKKKGGRETKAREVRKGIGGKKESHNKGREGRKGKESVK